MIMPQGKSIIKRPTDSTTSATSGQTNGEASTTSGQTSTRMERQTNRRVLRVREEYYE